MVSPTPAPTTDDLSVDSSANVEGILLTVLIVVLLFMLGAGLVWGGMRYWRANTPGAVDLATLEGLLDEQKDSGGGSSRRKKKDRKGSKKRKSKKKTSSIGSNSEISMIDDNDDDRASQASSHNSEIV